MFVKKIGILVALSKRVEAIQSMIEPAVNLLQCELWGLEFFTQGKHSLLRIYIEKAETGVTIDDCEAVSRQVSAILDVEDPIQGQYTLEVSSPGMDRPLFSVSQYQRFVGSNISLRLRVPLAGRRKFTGTLVSVDAEKITLSFDNESVEIIFDQIEKANIVPNYDEL